MITTGASPLELKFEVLFDGIPTRKASIQTVSIELQENMHNLAVLEIAGIPQSVLTDYMDIPVSIEIGVGNLSNHYFVGYVSYLEPVSKNKDGLVNNSPFQLTKVYCMGATYVMRNKRTRVWDKQTLPQIASALAKEYSLSVSVPNNSFIFPRIAQTGKSDWEILVEAADYLGYRVMSRGAHIDIWNPYALLSRNGGATPIYAMFGTQGNIKTQPGQVLDFHAYVGTVTPFGDTIPDTVHALSDGQIFTITKKQESNYGLKLDRPFTYEAAENVTSIEHASEFLTGTKHLPITAYATVVGDPSIEPGTLVNLIKYDSGLDGIWIVASAKHNMFRGSTTTELCLKRDTVSSSDPIIDTFISAPPYQLPIPLLQNQKWISPKEIIHVYS